MTFNVEFHPKAAKEAKDMLRMNLELNYDFRQYLEELAEEPYKFPKKQGKLKSCRALYLKVKGNAWRLIFRIIDARDLVEILAIGSHDDAYSSAEKRL
jgi:mRNA-degrading endonuclease RelE of RelBE toxin-antitoxin system